MILVFKRATYAYYALSRAAPEKRTISIIEQLKHLIRRKLQCKELKFCLPHFTALHIPHLNESMIGTMLHFRLINLFFFSREVFLLLSHWGAFHLCNSVG